jgi:hypothetical protein
VAAMEGMRRERGEGREFQPRAMEGRNKWLNKKAQMEG